MYRNVLSILTISLVTVGCGSDGSAADSQTEAPLPASTGGPTQEPELTATAILHNRQGQEIGTATLTQEGDEVVIAVNARNLEGGERAIHIHEVGQCETPDFQSAGGHFNPDSRAHGFDHVDGAHAGDLRNLVIDPDDGMANETYRSDRVSLRADATNSLLTGAGTAIVIHAGADDYESQPAGDAGDRIACGVITAA